MLPAMYLRVYRVFLWTICRLLCDLSGVEHHVRQLADVRLPHLVLRAVDGARPEALRDALLSLHGGVRQPADCAAVHLEFRKPSERLGSVCQEEQPFPFAVIQGLGLSLCSTYMQSLKLTFRLQLWLNMFQSVPFNLTLSDCFFHASLIKKEGNHAEYPWREGQRRPVWHVLE